MRIPSNNLESASKILNLCDNKNNREENILRKISLFCPKFKKSSTDFYASASLTVGTDFHNRNMTGIKLAVDKVI